MKLRFVPTHPIIFNTIKYYFTSVWNTELKATIFSLNYHFTYNNTESLHSLYSAYFQITA